MIDPNLKTRLLEKLKKTINQYPVHDFSQKVNKDCNGNINEYIGGLKSLLDVRVPKPGRIETGLIRHSKIRKNSPISIRTGDINHVLDFVRNPSSSLHREAPIQNINRNDYYIESPLRVLNKTSINFTKEEAYGLDVIRDRTNFLTADCPLVRDVASQRNLLNNWSESPENNKVLKNIYRELRSRLNLRKFNLKCLKKLHIDFKLNYFRITRIIMAKAGIPIDKSKVDKIPENLTEKDYNFVEQLVQDPNSFKGIPEDLNLDAGVIQDLLFHGQVLDEDFMFISKSIHVNENFTNFLELMAERAEFLITTIDPQYISNAIALSEPMLISLGM